MTLVPVHQSGGREKQTDEPERHDPQAIVLSVAGQPPSKEGDISIRNPAHRQHSRVVRLREQMAMAMRGRHPFASQHLRLEIHYRRGSGTKDPANIIGGVADVLQKAPVRDLYPQDVWVYDDDKNLHEILYREEPALEDSYTVTVHPIDRIHETAPRGVTTKLS